YRALAGAGRLTPPERAARAAPSERYVRERPRGQAAGGAVSYREDSDRYWMPPEQVLAFADPDGLVLPGAFQLAVACLADLPAITEAFRTGGGVAWGDHHPDVFTGRERFFRPSYAANLVSSLIPAIACVGERVASGAAEST